MVQRVKRVREEYCEEVNGNVYRYYHAPEPIEFPVEEEVPEGIHHFRLRKVLYDILELELGTSATIGSDQFVYWDATDSTKCVSPDVMIQLGRADVTFDNWKIWERGAPHVAIEMVSKSDRPKWKDKLDSYRRVGVLELIRFDADDAKKPLRIWDALQGSLVERKCESATSARSRALNLWWVVVRDEYGLRWLRLARDPFGRELLPSPKEVAAAAQKQADASQKEAATAQKQAEHAWAEKEAEHRAKEEALSRLEQLQAELALLKNERSTKV